jgi:uncharacterized membrane protein
MFLTSLRVVGLLVGGLTAVLYGITPNLTRRDLYFAVTVPAEFRSRPEGIAILRRYHSELAAVSVLGLAAIAVSSHITLLLLPLAILAQHAGSFLVFYRARARVLPHATAPTSIREAEPLQRPRRIPGGWATASGPFVLLAAAAAYLWAHWLRIPARFPVHWGLGGTPDRWADRNWTSVYFPLLITATVLVALTLFLYGMTHWLRPIQPGGLPGARETRFRRTASSALLALEYAIALQASWMALHPLIQGFGPGATAGAFLLLLPLPIAIILVVILARLGQGGSKLAPASESQQSSSQPIGDRTADHYWLLGVFYINRDDPAVLVEKRFGIGYTLNFARPTSWTILLIVLLLPLTVALVRYLR